MDLELVFIGLLIFEVNIVELPLIESVGFNVFGEVVVFRITEKFGDQVGHKLFLDLRNVSFYF